MVRYKAKPGPPGTPCPQIAPVRLMANHRPDVFLSRGAAGLCLSVVKAKAMLTTLRIKNLALVSDLTLELQPGCNAITGETGAGKSIILGALNLVLGERADRTLIRSGEDSCSVEAVFDTKKLRCSV